MYCRIVKTEREQSITGTDRWVLTHICGKVERRVRRPGKKAPNKVKCDGAPADKAAADEDGSH